MDENGNVSKLNKQNIGSGAAGTYEIEYEKMKVLEGSTGGYMLARLLISGPLLSDIWY